MNQDTEGRANAIDFGSLGEETGCAKRSTGRSDHLARDPADGFILPGCPALPC